MDIAFEMEVFSKKEIYMWTLQMVGALMSMLRETAEARSTMQRSNSF
jgi:hypothetical protein